MNPTIPQTPIQTLKIKRNIWAIVYDVFLLLFFYIVVIIIRAPVLLVSTLNSAFNPAYVGPGFLYTYIVPITLGIVYLIRILRNKIKFLNPFLTRITIQVLLLVLCGIIFVNLNP